MITLGKRSLDNLKGVHPKLVAVVKRAASLATPAQDFTVVQGVRSREDMCVNYGKGRTAAQCVAKGVPASYAKPKEAKVTWLKDPFASNHGVKADGFGHAVDVYPYPIDYDDHERFRELSKVILGAAQQEGVTVIWGGQWKSSPDLPHYEIKL